MMTVIHDRSFSLINKKTAITLSAVKVIALSNAKMIALSAVTVIALSKAKMIAILKFSQQDRRSQEINNCEAIGV
jgi:hypothetical protein